MHRLYTVNDHHKFLKGTIKIQPDFRNIIEFILIVIVTIVTVTMHFKSFEQYYNI